MKVELFIKSRSDVFFANAIYEDGTITVKKGSKVNMTFAEHIKGGRTAKKYLCDRQFVDEKGVVKKDCSFSSPSTAAQFVTGCSSNGNRVWKTKDGEKLKEILRKEDLQ